MSRPVTSDVPRLMGNHVEVEAGPSAFEDPPRGLLIMNAELVERIAEEILREAAWWIGARTGKYVVKSTLWTDGRCVMNQEAWPHINGAGDSFR